MEKPPLEWYTATSLQRLLDAVLYVHSTQFDIDRRFNLTRAIRIATAVLRFNASADVVVAALLHNVIVDNIAKHPDLTGQFGRPVADLVQEYVGGDQVGCALLPAAELRDRIASMSEAARLIKLIVILNTVQNLGPVEAATDWAKQYAAQIAELVHLCSEFPPTIAHAIFSALRRQNYVK